MSNDKACLLLRVADRFRFVSLLLAAGFVAGCSENHSSIDAVFGPDDSLVVSGRGGGGAVVFALFIPVGDSCLAVGVGQDEAPYSAPDLTFTTSARYALQDGLSYPDDCPAAVERWYADRDYEAREDVRVELSGTLALDFTERFDQLWSGELHYLESWPGGRARVVMLDHVPVVFADR